MAIWNTRADTSFSPQGRDAWNRLLDKVGERVDVSDGGVSPSMSPSDQRTKIQDAIDALQSGQELHINEHYTINGAGLTITNKTDIRITGKGGIALSGANVDAIIFKLVGTIDNLMIDGLELSGDNNAGATYFQQCIGNDSGQTISNVWFCFNKCSDINNGISLNANLSGTYTKGHVLYNTIKNMRGTDGGQGYGIHLAKATQCVVMGNALDDCSRHSIYQAAGTDVGAVITGNVIRNHRLTAHTGDVRSAIACLRSSGVVISNNFLHDGYDSAMRIGQATEDSIGAGDVEVFGNTFYNRKDTVSSIYVGEQAVPGDYETTNVRIHGNKFQTDESGAAAGGAEITIWNGRFINVDNNFFHKTGVAATATFVVWGDNATITDAVDFTDCGAQNNVLVCEGSSLTDTRGFSLATEVSTGTSSHRFDNRKNTNMAFPVRHGTTPTNPNLMAITELRCCVLNNVASVGAGTTAGRARTNAAVRIASGRSSFALASTDDYWNLSTVTTGASTVRYVLLCVEDGTTARIVVGEEAANAAAAKMPRIPRENWAALGAVLIGNSYSGGALGSETFINILGHYEN